MSQDSGEHRRSLDVHFAGGVAWTAGAKWVTQLLSWVTVFGTAHLLSTSDFGISEMASYFFVLTNVLAEFGVGTAVLQMQELERNALAQLHAFSCLLATLAYLLSLAAAPLIASFFQNEHLTKLIMVSNLGFFIVGFQAVPMGLLQRNMDYRRLSMADAFQILVQSVLTLAAAWAGMGYWSLVLGAFVAKAAAAVLVSYWQPVSFVMPRWKEIRKPIQLGRQAAIGRLAWACYTQADGIIVGRVLGDSTLGIYRMAMNLATAPAEKLSSLIMRSAGPLFAKVQSDTVQVRRYFLILTEFLTMMELPLMLGLGMVAPEAVQVILGPKWAGLVGPLRWLVVFMTIRTVGTLMEQVLISQRATAFTMRLSLLTLFVMPAVFFPAAHWKGTSGVAASWILLAPLTIFPLAWRLVRTIRLNLGEFGGAVLPAISGAAAMVGALFGVRMWLAQEPWPAVVKLAIQIAAGGVVYSAVLFLLFRERIFKYGRFLRDLRKDREAPHQESEGVPTESLER